MSTTLGIILDPTLGLCLVITVFLIWVLGGLTTPSTAIWDRTADQPRRAGRLGAEKRDRKVDASV